MNLFDYQFVPLSDDIDVYSFDCDDADINDFLKNDSFDYQKQKIANTYLFLNELGKVVFFFSVSNDRLGDSGEEFSNTIWNRFHRKTRIGGTYVLSRFR